MSLFGIIHGLAALLGLGAAVGLIGQWADKQWELKMAMWLGAVGALGSGVVISLSFVGTGVQILTPMLLGKVVLSIVLVALMYTTLGDSEPDDLADSRTALFAIGGLWLVLLAMGALVGS